MTLWTVAHQDPLSMGFSRQEYWSGVPFPSPGGLPGPQTEPMSPALTSRYSTTEPAGKPSQIASRLSIYFKYIDLTNKKPVNHIYKCQHLKISIDGNALSKRIHL